MTFNKDWFRGAVNSGTPFGYDVKTFPGKPRLHPAQDYSPLNSKRLETIAYSVINGQIEWLVDTQGNSVFWQKGTGLDVRYYHFHREELSSEAIAAMTVKGFSMNAGTPIGPAGNVGISVASAGNDGSHVHLVIIAYPELYDSVADIVGVKFWHVNKIDQYIKQYGQPFKDIVDKWQIEWMNEDVIARFDPFRQRMGYFLNPKKVLGW